MEKIPSPAMRPLSYDLSPDAPAPVSEELLRSTARAYLSVFSNPTWNAWRFDPALDASVDGATGKVARTVAQQADRVLAEAFAPGRRSVVRLLEDGGRVAGFAWGWEDTLRGLNASKFALDPEKFQSLAAASSSIGILPDDPVFYLSQVGLLEAYRGAGLGKSLVREVQRGAASLGLAGRTVLRTASTRDLPYRMFLRDGGRVLASGFDAVGNVIMTAGNGEGA